MIVIFCARYCEAKPFVAHYGLQKLQTPAFLEFADSEAGVRLVVTGVGEIAAAAAVGSACSGSSAGDVCLFHVGSAAGLKKDRGKAFLCNKITEASTGRAFYPDLLCASPFEEREVQTLAAFPPPPELDTGRLYDREAAGIYQAGSFFVGPHQMQFVKIVTDSGTGEAASGETEAYISAVLPQIAAYIGRIKAAQADWDEEKNVVSKEDLAYMQRMREAFCCSRSMGDALDRMVRYAILSGVDYRGIVEALYQEGTLPCRDRRTGKRYLDEFRQKLF